MNVNSQVAQSTTCDTTDLQMNQWGRLSERQGRLLQDALWQAHHYLTTLVYVPPKPAPPDKGLAAFVRSTLWRAPQLITTPAYAPIRFAPLDKLKEDLRNPIVRWADGHIVGSRFIPIPYCTFRYAGNWVARPLWSNRDMILAPGLALLPGPYRLYYLQHSEIVVNAIPVQTQENYVAYYRYLLESVAQQNLASGTENRERGLMTTEQADYIWARAKSQFLWSSIGPIFMAFFFACCLSGPLNKALRELVSAPLSGNSLGFGPIVLVVVAAGTYLFAHPLPRAMAYLAAFRSRKLDTVTGSLRLAWSLDERDQPGEFTAIVGGTTYRVKRELWAALIDGRTYRVYIAQGTDLALAFEFLA